MTHRQDLADKFTPQAAAGGGANCDDNDGWIIRTRATPVAEWTTVRTPNSDDVTIRRSTRAVRQRPAPRGVARILVSGGGVGGAGL